MEGLVRGTRAGSSPGSARPAPSPFSGLFARRPRPGSTTRSPSTRRPGEEQEGMGTPGWGGEASGPGDPLTFPQPVLEVGVTPSLAVEVNAVPDEKGPAHAGGDGAVPAHHLLSNEEWGRRRRGPQSSRCLKTLGADCAAQSRSPPRGTRKGGACVTSGPCGRGPRGCPRQCLRGGSRAASAPAQGLGRRRRRRCRCSRRSRDFAGGRALP